MYEKNSLLGWVIFGHLKIVCSSFITNFNQEEWEELEIFCEFKFEIWYGERKREIFLDILFTLSNNALKKFWSVKYF